ncbi:MAG: dodecin [Verrucomicrobiales bacterium]
MSEEAHVYKLVELTGTSTKSVEDAIQTALARAAESLRHIRWFKVVETRGSVADGQVEYYQVTLKVGFTLDAEVGS